MSLQIEGICNRTASNIRECDGRLPTRVQSFGVFFCIFQTYGLQRLILFVPGRFRVNNLINVINVTCFLFKLFNPLYSAKTFKQYRETKDSCIILFPLQRHFC